MNSKLSTREKRLIYLLICFCIFAGSLYFLIMPTLAKNSELSDKAVELQETKMSAELVEQNYDSWSSSIKEIQNNSVKLYQTFYPLSADEFLDRLLTTMATKHGLKPLNLEIEPKPLTTMQPFMAEPLPANPTPEQLAQYGTAYIKTVSLSSSGDLGGFSAMLSELNAMPQLVIKSFDTSKQADNSYFLTVTVEIMMVDPPPAEK